MSSDPDDLLQDTANDLIDWPRAPQPRASRLPRADKTLLTSVLIAVAVHGAALTVALWSFCRVGPPIAVVQGGTGSVPTGELTVVQIDAPTDIQVEPPEPPQSPRTRIDPAEALDLSARSQPVGDEPLASQRSDPADLAQPDWNQIGPRSELSAAVPRGAPTPPPVRRGTGPTAAAGNTPPIYPPEALRKQLQGTVVLHASLRDDGTVEKLGVSITSGQTCFDSAALDAVRLWKFRPATVEGHPVPSEIDLPVRFVLRS